MGPPQVVLFFVRAVLGHIDQPRRVSHAGLVLVLDDNLDPGQPVHRDAVQAREDAVAAAGDVAAEADRE